MVATALACVLVMVVVAGGFLVDRSAPVRRQAASEGTPTSTGLRSASSDGGFAEVYARTADGVGRVEVDTCGVDGWNGSGFLLSPRLALTAHHVLADASQVRVVFDHKVVTARVGRVDRGSDLALLELDEPVRGHVFDLVDMSPMTGTQVGVIGFPLDEPKTLTVGTVSGLDREVTTETGSYTQMLQTDTAINPGSSGAPVLDLQGRIVGVADAMRTDAQGIGFAVPASAVRRLLESQADAEQMHACS